MTSKGNFKVRVVQNIGVDSEDVFGPVGSVLIIEDGIFFDTQDNLWSNDGDGYGSVRDINKHMSDKDEWQTVFELVEEPDWCKKAKENSMLINDYQKKSLRTLNTEGKSQEQIISGLLLGIHGESGEISDIFKKHYNQGHELDLDHVKEEIGDTMFYIVNLCNVLGIDMGEVLEKNVAKLLERYPNGFEEERSTNRYNRLD